MKLIAIFVMLINNNNYVSHKSLHLKYISQAVATSLVGIVDKPSACADCFIMENSQEEIWLPVTGYEEYYEISNFGNVKMLQRRIDRIVNGASRGYIKPEKLFTQNSLKGGYRSVYFTKTKGNFESKRIHSLVAKHFIPNPQNKPCVNHIDGNKGNNVASNLEWCTYAENTHHAWATGLCVPVKGERSHNAKLKDAQVIEIKKLLSEGIISTSKIAKMFSTSQPNIMNIKSGRIWSHLNYNKKNNE